MSRWAGRATVLLMLLALSMAPEFIQATIPTHPLAGGGEMPMLMMGGNDFAGWFAAAGKGAGIQTFHGYGNGPHIAPQLQKAGTTCLSLREFPAAAAAATPRRSSP
jgi:hypothetical protein